MGMKHAQRVEERLCQRLRAEPKLEGRLSQSEKVARSRAVSLLEALKGTGWRPLSPRADLSFPLTGLFPLSRVTRDYSSPSGDELHALAQLDLVIGKHHIEISAFTTLYNMVDLLAYVRSRRRLLEETANPGSCSLKGDMARASLWRIAGGWGDEVDWDAITPEIATRTGSWREAFKDLSEECTGLLGQWSREDARWSQWSVPGT